MRSEDGRWRRLRSWAARRRGWAGSWVPQVRQARRPRGARVGTPARGGTRSHADRAQGLATCPGHSDNRDCLCDFQVTLGQVTPRNEQESLSEPRVRFGDAPGSHVTVAAAGHRDPVSDAVPSPCPPHVRGDARFLGHRLVAAPSLLPTLSGPCHCATCTPTAPHLQTNSTHTIVARESPLGAPWSPPT